MAIREMQAGDQTIRYDREQTAAAYAARSHGFAEECGCVFCRNFAAQRSAVYPASFRAMLQELGIDPAKEGEVFEYGPVADGCHAYGGRFPLAGELVTAGERNVAAEDAHQFEFFFARGSRKTPGFPEGQVLMLEFSAHLKWVLPERPEYRKALRDIRP